MASSIRSQLSLLLPLLLIAFSSCVSSEDVITLDITNFDEALKKHDFILVEFYAPWCGHCKQLAPEYEKAASIIKEKGLPIVLAKVDANEDKNKPLASRFEIQGFPTLKLIRNETNIQEYNGPRDGEGIAQYLISQSGPASTFLETKEQADEFFASRPIVLVAILENENSPELETFLSAANTLRTDYSFAHTFTPSLLPDVGATIKDPINLLRLFKPFDEKFNDLSEFSIEAITKFLEDKSVPLIVEMNKAQTEQSHLQKVFNSPLPKVLIFYKYSLPNAEELKSLFYESAKTYNGKYKFVYGDVADNEQALEYFGVSEDETPAIMVHEASNKKYVSKNADSAAITKFLEDYSEGKLQSFIKSEPIPETNDGPVKIVVAKNFEEIVFNSGKNVLLEFYAPWCGHCKKLTPIYEKLAISFSDDPSIIIAKIDATANDIPSDKFTVSGFPTIVLHTSTGEIVTYGGNRSLKDLTKFVKENKTEVEPEVLEEAKDEEDEEEPKPESKDEL